MKHRRVAIAALAIAVLTVVPHAEASTVGVGAGAAQFKVYVSINEFSGGNGSVRGLHLNGDIVAGTTVIPGADLSFGVFKGPHGYCPSPSSCTYIGDHITFFPYDVPVTGTTAIGETVTGICNGGLLKFGHFGGAVMSTKCHLTVRAVETDAFPLQVGGYVSTGARPGPINYVGHFCTSVPCAVVLDWYLLYVGPL